MKALHLIKFITLLFLSCDNKNNSATSDDFHQPVLKDTLFRIPSTYELGDPFGYVNQKGDTVIPFGKYTLSYTDTILTYGILAEQGNNLIAINQQEEKLFEVFWFDNGPDYIQEGLFRILKNNKIGYADGKTGIVIIEPQFDCAFPFENGKAKVSNNCKTQVEGEHKIWTSENWFYIDKTGKEIK